MLKNSLMAAGKDRRNVGTCHDTNPAPEKGFVIQLIKPEPHSVLRNAAHNFKKRKKKHIGTIDGHGLEYLPQSYIPDYFKQSF